MQVEHVIVHTYHRSLIGLFLFVEFSLPLASHSRFMMNFRSGCFSIATGRRLWYFRLSYRYLFWLGGILFSLCSCSGLSKDVLAENYGMFVSACDNYRVMPVDVEGRFESVGRLPAPTCCEAPRKRGGTSDKRETRSRYSWTSKFLKRALAMLSLTDHFPAFL